MNTELVGQGLSDFDALVPVVRDPESKRLIGEAIAAYRGRAFRSAVVATWIAVTYDLISKARELANHGEGASREFVENLDRCIQEKNVPKLQSIERGILKTANVDLQLLASHELTALERIHEDRNLCAHPAFVLEDELFQPTAEQVKGHIVHAIRFLLVHAPLQGKSAIDRFHADVLAPSFPVTEADIGRFMRSRYLDRAKDVLVVNLIKSVLSVQFGSDGDNFAGMARTLALVLGEISKAKPDLYDDVTPNYVQKKFAQINDEVLLKLCSFIGVDRRIWHWLDEPERVRIQRLLETADVEALKTHSAFDAFSATPISAILLSRFNGFDNVTKLSIISSHPRREFVRTGIEIYSSASSYRDAERLGQSMIIPLSEFFEVEDVRLTLDAASDNGQIRYASGTPRILEHLFNKTRSLLSDCREFWERFVQLQIDRMNGDTTEYYAYPNLQNLLKEESDLSVFEGSRKRTEHPDI